MRPLEFSPPVPIPFFTLRALNSRIAFFPLGDLITMNWRMNRQSITAFMAVVASTPLFLGPPAWAQEKAPDTQTSPEDRYSKIEKQLQELTKAITELKSPPASTSKEEPKDNKEESKKPTEPESEKKAWTGELSKDWLKEFDGEILGQPTWVVGS